MYAVIQVWKNHELISDYDYDPEENQMETMEDFFSRIHDLEVGDGFTYIVHRTA